MAKLVRILLEGGAAGMTQGPLGVDGGVEVDELGLLGGTEEDDEDEGMEVDELGLLGGTEEDGEDEGMEVDELGLLGGTEEDDDDGGTVDAEEDVLTVVGTEVLIVVEVDCSTTTELDELVEITAPFW
jgi:hypothetical protein